MQHQLAQLNIARMKYTYEDPEMAYFVAQLDPVNALADSSPGFVWRLQTDEGNATAYDIFEDPGYLVNMSVWESLEQLGNFFRAELHMDVVRRRKQWFDAVEEATMVLWWVPAGHQPEVAEAQARLEYLRSHGSTTHAFTFREPYPRPESAA